MSATLNSIASTRAFYELLSNCSKSGRTLVVDFYADWCRPCNQVAPQFQALATEFSSRKVVFVKANADTCQELCNNEFVSVLPTFKVYRQGECVATVVGGNLIKLRSLVETYALDLSVTKIANCHDTQLRNSAIQCLTKILGNVLAGTSADSREICKDKDEFKKYLSVPGCMEFLFAAGFQEVNGVLILHDPINKPKMRILLDHLQSFDTTGTAGASVKPQPATSRARLAPVPSGPPLPGEDSFFRKLKNMRSMVVQYLDPEAQAIARSLLPTAKLMEDAARKSGRDLGQLRPRDVLAELVCWFKNDFFRWADEFKCDTCGTKMQLCQSSGPELDTERRGKASVVEVYACESAPTEHALFRFPRYNCVRQLMTSRLGRCGEYANCLAHFLVSCQRPASVVGGGGQWEAWFPACRLVHDHTDHLWCEVWLEDDNKPGSYGWRHCDPGGEIDQPLLYESGWGKKLTYIMAYTVPPACVPWNLPGLEEAVDVQDVTWRYTRNVTEVCSRRRATSELRLAAELTSLHLKSTGLWERHGVVASADSPYTLKAVLHELVSFLNPPKAPETRLPGRKTGSLEWRRARGELGADAEEEDEPGRRIWQGCKPPIQPSASELEKGCFYLRYNSALDIYQRPFMSANPATSPSDGSPSQKEADDSRLPAADRQRPHTADDIAGWQTMLSKWCNIARKVERDWHMVYLAREENSHPSDDGVVVWELDLRGTGYRVGKVSLFANMVCHSPDCAATMTLSDAQNDDSLDRIPTGKCIRLEPGSTPPFEVTDFVGATYIRLEGRLWTKVSEENTANEDSFPSNVAWQQAQLFRQKENDVGIWSLEWKVQLQPEKSE